jgi:hypothetical protein
MDDVDCRVVLSELAPIYLIEFTHGGEFRYCAAFDKNFVVLAENIVHAEISLQHTIGSLAFPALAEAIMSLYRSNFCKDDGLSLPFGSATVATRMILADLSCKYSVPAPLNYYLTDETNTTALYVRQGEAIRSISVSLCKDLFKQRCPQLFNDFIAGAPLLISDLSDNVQLALTNVVCLSEFHYAYCFNSQQNDRSVVLLVSNHHTAVLAIYFPESDIVVNNYLTEEIMWQGRTAPSYLGRDLRTSFLINLFGFLKSLRNVEQPLTACLVLRERHLGHHLWNELGGLDAFLERRPKRSFRLLVTAGNESEAYGRVDDIFPELAGSINRQLLNWEQFSNYVYQNSLIPLRYTTNIVSRQLAKRIIAASERAISMTERSLVLQARSEQRRILMLGIRLQDRTVEDPLQFFVVTIRKLNDILGPLLVVVDGHNTPNPGTELAHDAFEFIEKEKMFVSELAKQIAGLDVKLLSTIGKTMSHSVFWSSSSDFFVAIWGGGLAKYRWIANKPGFIVSSRYNIEQRHDFHIYDSNEYMELPTKVMYPPSEIIYDLPLSISARPDLANFRIDIDKWEYYLQNTAFALSVDFH